MRRQLQEKKKKGLLEGAPRGRRGSRSSIIQGGKGGGGGGEVGEGKLVVTVKEAKGLASKDVLNSSDPYVVLKA